MAMTYLIYTAVVGVVPLLADALTHKRSIVAKHRSAEVHHHCVQRVLAVVLGKDIVY